MRNTLDNLLEEKISLLGNEMEKNKIQSKTMAEFAIIFYEKYTDNYDEALFIQICKRIMNFYNEAIKNIPDKDKEYRLNNIIKNLSNEKDKISSFLKEKDIPTEVPKEKFNMNDIEDRYKSTREEVNKLIQKKPFFKKKWYDKLKDAYQKLEKIRFTIESYREDERNSEKNRKLKKVFEDLIENFKKFLSEVDGEIGIEIAQQNISYENAIQDEASLQNITYNFFLEKLYSYFQKKK